VTVRSVMSTIPLNLAFRRFLAVANLEAWYNVVAMVANMQLTNQRDHIVRGLYIKIGCFLLNQCIGLY
jgi:hypothetical protein